MLSLLLLAHAALVPVVHHVVIGLKPGFYAVRSGPEIVWQLAVADSAGVMEFDGPESPISIVAWGSEPPATRPGMVDVR